MRHASNRIALMRRLQPVPVSLNRKRSEAPLWQRSIFIDRRAGWQKEITISGVMMSRRHSNLIQIRVFWPDALRSISLELLFPSLKARRLVEGAAMFQRNRR